MLAWPRGLAAQPADPQADAGIAAYRAGRYGEAVRDLSASLNAGKTLKVALFLGNAYLRLGQFDGATKTFAVALTLGAGAKAAAISSLVDAIAARDATPITVTSTPPGGTVFIDGKRYAGGVTPLVVNLSSGKHEIRIEHPDRAPEIKEVRVKTGKPAKVAVALEPPHCKLVLRGGAVRGTTISIDGGAPQTMPAKASPGEHRAVFAAPGFRPTGETFRCAAGGTLDFDPDLVATP